MSKRICHRRRALLNLALLLIMAARAPAKTPDELLADAQRDRQGLGEPSAGGSEEPRGIYRTWTSGTCVVIENYDTQGGQRRNYDLTGKKKGWESGSIVIEKGAGGCHVKPDSARGGLKETFTASCDDTRVHSEYARDGGVRGDIYDFTLQGEKLVGTHTEFDKYHGSQTVERCELETMHLELTPEQRAKLERLSPEEIQRLTLEDLERLLSGPPP